MVGALGPITVAIVSITLTWAGHLRSRVGIKAVGHIDAGLPPFTVCHLPFKSCCCTRKLRSSNLPMRSLNSFYSLHFFLFAWSAWHLHYSFKLANMHGPLCERHSLCCMATFACTGLTDYVLCTAAYLDTLIHECSQLTQWDALTCPSCNAT